MSLTQQAHQAVLSHLESLGKQQLCFSIDATCGNGFDTLFLAEITEKTVFSFDIQEAAITNTQKRLNKTPSQDKVTLIHQNHANMLEYCQQHQADAIGKVDAITFNLGYLPRADKSITTAVDSTVAALNAALKLLSPDGTISIICYRGHNGGLLESQAVLALLKAQGQLCYETIDSTMANETTPFLLIIKHKK